MQVIEEMETEIGLMSLTERYVTGIDEVICEIRIGEDVLMTSLSPISEKRLAEAALAWCTTAGPLSILVGGLGLGYTAHAATCDERVSHVHVVEAMDFMIRWMKEGRFPLSANILADKRFLISQKDVYAQLLAPPTKTYDLLLIDVDHTPTDPLAESSLPFYTQAGQKSVMRHLRPGGVLAVWSAVEDANFSHVLSQVYAKSDCEDVFWLDREYPEADFQNVLFLAQRAS